MLSPIVIVRFIKGHLPPSGCRITRSPLNIRNCGTSRNLCAPLLQCSLPQKNSDLRPYHRVTPTVKSKVTAPMGIRNIFSVPLSNQINHTNTIIKRKYGSHDFVANIIATYVLIDVIAIGCSMIAVMLYVSIYGCSKLFGIMTLACTSNDYKDSQEYFYNVDAKKRLVEEKNRLIEEKKYRLNEDKHCLIKQVSSDLDYYIGVRRRRVGELYATLYDLRQKHYIENTSLTRYLRDPSYVERLKELHEIAVQIMRIEVEIMGLEMELEQIELYKSTKQ